MVQINNFSLTSNIYKLHGSSSTWCMEHPKICNKWQWKKWSNTMN
jgi:hypothetical protein